MTPAVHGIWRYARRHGMRYAAGAGCLLVTATGWISLRPVLRTPPRQVLAGS